MKVIRLVIRIALIYVQISQHGDIIFEHESEQDICRYIYIHTQRGYDHYFTEVIKSIKITTLIHV
jgi:hypothetical protein